MNTLSQHKEWFIRLNTLPSCRKMSPYNQAVYRCVHSLLNACTGFQMHESLEQWIESTITALEQHVDDECQCLDAVAMRTGRMPIIEKEPSVARDCINATQLQHEEG